MGSFVSICEALVLCGTFERRSSAIRIAGIHAWRRNAQIPEFAISHPNGLGFVQQLRVTNHKLRIVGFASWGGARGVRYQHAELQYSASNFEALRSDKPIAVRFIWHVRRQLGSVLRNRVASLDLQDDLEQIAVVQARQTREGIEIQHRRLATRGLLAHLERGASWGDVQRRQASHSAEELHLPDRVAIHSWWNSLFRLRLTIWRDRVC